MANRWKGNFVVAANVTSSGTAYNGRADGAWGLNNQLQQKQGSLWSVGIGPPTPPINVSATASNMKATVSFTPQATGGGTVTYTATSTPGNITATGSTSPIAVTGLTNGTSYTFTVKGTNTFGYTSANSVASNAVIPVATLVAFNGGNSPYLDVYNFTVAGGFGTRVSTSTPANGGGPIKFNSTGTHIAFTSVDGGYSALYIYPISATGLGTRVTNPTLTGVPAGVAFSPDNSTFVYVSDTSPYILAYPWSGSLGTKYANPATLPQAAGRKVAFNTSGNTVITTVDASPYVAAYAWSNGFGTRYANPASLPTALTRCVDIKTTNVVLGQNSGVSFAAYPWSSGFGAKYSAPSSVPTNSTSIKDVAFNSTGTLLLAAFGSATPSSAWVYPFSESGFGTAYASPSSPVSYCTSIAFNSSDNVIFAGNGGDGGVAAWAFNNGFGTKYADPATPPASGSPSGIATTPF